MAAPLRINPHNMVSVPKPLVSGTIIGIDGNAELSKVLLDTGSNLNFIDSDSVRAAGLRTQDIVPFPIRGLGKGSTTVNKSVSFMLTIGFVTLDITAFVNEQVKGQCCLLLSATAMHAFKLMLDSRTDPFTIWQYPNADDEDDEDDEDDDCEVVDTVNDEDEPYVEWVDMLCDHTVEVDSSGCGGRY